ncbi:MAG: endonuclease/exonuclease/phosphatase family protein [Pseudomonadota bacterium]
MQIMCLNGWGGKLHDALVSYLAAADPDILCLQEVVHTPDAPAEWLTYRDGDHVLEQRADMLADIELALPEHRAVFCPAARGVLWHGEVSVPSYWGLATWIRRDLSVIGQVQGFVHKSFSADGYGDHPRSRSAHVIRVSDPANARPVTVGHMHGLRVPGDKRDTPERLEQARRFAGLIEAVHEGDDRLVVCGDFNVLPDSGTFEVLEHRLGVRDLVTGRGFTGTRTPQYRKPDRFADYMLVNAAVTVRSFDVVASPEVSDHCPLVLDLG